MKTLSYLFLIFCLIQFAGCRNKEIPSDLQDQLDSISAVMVPQHDEALCDLSLSMGEGKSIIVSGETNLPDAKATVITTLGKSGFTVIDSIRILPDTSVVKKPWGLVSVSVCNMRYEPGHDEEMATQALMGTPVKILDKRGKWLLIQTPDSYIGWTDDPVAKMSEEEFLGWKNGDRLFYLRNTGVITDAHDLAVSDIVFGVIVQKTGVKGDRFSVKLPDGREGFIKKAEVADFGSWAENTVPDAGKMVAFARSSLGLPYLWGGTSTKGFDCSGFAKTIYYSGGLILTRDADGQYRYGTERSIENGCDSLAPGDLLYFGSIRDGKKRITHTGMYIGDTEFIHSSSAHPLRINSFDSTRANYNKYLIDILLGAKRLIGLTPAEGFVRVSQHSWYF